MIFEPVLFGILQGIFEWLPISSQGNLVLIMSGLFGYAAETSIKYSIFLHSGTLAAAIVYFRKDIIRMLKELKGYKPDFSENNRLITFLIISTFMTGLIGYPILKFIMLSNFAGEMLIGLVGVALIVTGIIQKISINIGLKTEKNIGFKDTILLGIAQGFSAIPGISRSGITVSAFLMRGYSSKESLRLSFLMSIPAILIAEIGLAFIEGLPDMIISEALIGLAFSFIVGLISIHALLKIAEKVKFWIFCIVIGIVALLPLLLYL